MGLKAKTQCLRRNMVISVLTPGGGFIEENWNALLMDSFRLAVPLYILDSSDGILINFCYLKKC
jgi:hypothetical protein